MIALGFPKPPDSISAQQLFAKVEQRIKEQLEKVPKDYLGKALLTGGALSAQQWKKIEEMNNSMSDEYKMRSEMLLKRLDVTIQSFTWSDRVKVKFMN